MTYSETDVVASIEYLSGTPVREMTQDELDLVDQFHVGGAQAVDRIVTSLRPTPGMTVLDIGSGLGGPARHVARQSGCSVVGVDITPAYVNAAQELTDAAGLSARVQFVCTDIAHLEAPQFDAAYTMHVQMNVSDKAAFFAAIARRLRPGARFAVFEVCRTGEAQPSPPLPWSLDGTDSFLATAAQLRATIESCGFEVEEWADETGWILKWFEDAATRMAAAGSRATLPAILADGPVRMMNFAGAIATGTLSIHRGSFTLAREST